MTRKSSDPAGSTSSVNFRVAITGDFENLALGLAPWNTLGADTQVETFTQPFGSVQDTVAALKDFDAITLMHERIPLTREILDQLKRLKVIVFSGSKNMTLDDRAATERGIVVCQSNPKFEVPAGELGGNSPSELAIGLLLGCTWQIAAGTALIREGGWAFRPGIPLRGKTLGIIGYGRIGRPVARVGLALGMRVLAFNRNLTGDAARVDNVTRADLDTLLRNSDVISIHLPLNASTRGMIGEREIALMKDNVILINTARAAIVAEAPFIAALQRGKISMAGLDVFWEEPLPAKHPLKQLPNVAMTPHIGYSTEETMVVRYRGLLDVLAAYRQGNIIGAYTSKTGA
ncbi:MAG TPA: D-2-hydroxyacid dehydrogenase family protein [Steroidobacteraceae bacterium]|jgi:phosphoglycerate dehydrogenase-like enzyme